MTGLMRRRGFARALGAAASATLLGGFADGWQLAPEDLATRPGFGFAALKFRLTDAATDKTVTEADFRGRVTMLMFGYTNCTDVCPLTLNNAARLFHIMGNDAANISFLFVTVDPGRDTVPVLRTYTQAFGAPNIIGLRGSEAELAAVAARMGARYSVHPSSDPEKYEVTHTSLTYVFNREGKPEFSIAGLSRPKLALNGIARDLAHLEALDHV